MTRTDAHEMRGRALARLATRRVEVGQVAMSRSARNGPHARRRGGGARRGSRSRTTRSWTSDSRCWRGIIKTHTICPFCLLPSTRRLLRGPWETTMTGDRPLCSKMPPTSSDSPILFLFWRGAVGEHPAPETGENEPAEIIIEPKERTSLAISPLAGLSRHLHLRGSE